MRRYLVVAHRTLGGDHLFDHLHEMRAADPYCQFHLIVPQHHPHDHAWTDTEVHHTAQIRLDEMIDEMAMMGMGATGEVGDTNPVSAVGDALRREGKNAFEGIVLSTLPRGISRWWLFDVPRRMAKAYPSLPLTHIVAEDAHVS